MALGSRLRQISALITDDAAKIYQLYGFKFSPKWFPVFYTLNEKGHMTITDIANFIGHSQPSVTKIIKEMINDGLVLQHQKSPDKRQNMVCLSEKGIKTAGEMMQYQAADIEKALESLMSESKHNLWEALEEWENLLMQKPLYQRVVQQKKQREAGDVIIVNYEQKYRNAFAALNEEWISAYFELEESDRKALHHPEKNILEKDGHILVALLEEEVVGVCALIKMDDPLYDFELAKMAVSPSARGKNIGFQLARAVINKARDLGASTLYLESNTLLKPAISLYYKLGFKEVTGRPSPYKRCNIQMELHL